MISQVALDSTGRVQADTTMIPAFIAGIGYAGGSVYADAAAVAATDSFINGFRVSAVGALKIYDATAGLPVTTNINRGFTMTEDGQVCYSSDANSGPSYINGIAFDSVGRVYMDVT